MSTHPSELFHSNGEFVKEKYEDLIMRYSGFGIELLIMLKNNYNDIFSKLDFYKDQKSYHQDLDDLLPDSFSLYRNGVTEFAIQLDPEIEVICIWNKNKHIEINSYWKNPVQKSMEIILEEFIH